MKYQILALFFEMLYRSKTQNILSYLTPVVRPIILVFATLLIGTDIFYALCLESLLCVHNSVVKTIANLKRLVFNVKIEPRVIFIFFLLRVLISLIPLFVIMIATLPLESYSITHIYIILLLAFTSYTVSSLIGVFTIIFRDIRNYISYGYYALIVVIFKYGTGLITNLYYLTLLVFLFLISLYLYKNIFYKMVESY